MAHVSHDDSGCVSPTHQPANNRSCSSKGGSGLDSPRQAQREVLASALRSKMARNGFDSAVMERIVNPMLLLQQPEPALDAAVLRKDALAKAVSSTLKRRWAKESLFQRFCRANRGLGPRGQVGRGGGQGVDDDAAASADTMSLGDFLELLEAGLGLLAPGMKMSREGAGDIFRSEADGIGMVEDQEGLQDGVEVEGRGGNRTGTRVGGGRSIGQDGPGEEKVIRFAGFVRCMDMVARWHGLPSLRSGGGSGGDSRSAQNAGPETFVRWCTDVEGAISDDDGLVLVDSFFDVLEGVGVIPGAISREDAVEAFGGRTGSIKPLEFRVYSRRIASMLFANRNHGSSGSSESILALVAAPSASLTSAPQSSVGDESGFGIFCDCSGLEVGLGRWAQHHLPASSTLRHVWMPVPHRILAKYTDLPFACGEDDLVFEEVDEAGDYEAGLKLLVKFRGCIRGKYGFNSDGHTAASTQEVIYAILRAQRCSATNPSLAWGLMQHALRLTQPTEVIPLYDKAGLRTWASGVMAKHLEIIGRHGAALPWCRAAIKTEKDERCLAWWAMLLSIILSSLRRHEGSVKASRRALQIILQHGKQLDEPGPGEEQGSRLDGTIATIVALHNCESTLGCQSCIRPMRVLLHRLERETRHARRQH